MRHYLTWEEFTKKYPRKDQYDCDEYSKLIIKTFVERYCGCTCTYFSTSKENSSTDFKMVNNTTGKTFLCEIKDRWNFNSTDYADHIFESGKLAGLMARKNRGEGQALSLFSIYKDGAFKMTANLEKNCLGTVDRRAPTTTALQDHSYKDKNFVLFKSDATKYFCICVDEKEDGTVLYFPVFSDSRLDVNKLNEAEKNAQFQLF